MQKTAFITGVTGQDGSYLAELLLSKKYKVVGLVSRKHGIGDQNIKHFKKKLILETGDLLDKKSLEKAILKHKPSKIYNLGGITFVPTSWEKPALTHDVNALGPTRILEIIRDHLPKTKFYQATTSKIFGKSKTKVQTEKTPINPVDPYSISKAAAHLTIKVFREKFGIFACSGILYNHESPRRGPQFVTRKITQGAVKIKLGMAKSLSLGNLDAKQDWGWAPDYVEAMWLILQQNSPENYIVCTGKLHSVRDVCRIAFSHLGLDYKKYVRRDQKFYRKIEAGPNVGNPQKAKRILGWQPKTSFKEMVERMVKYDLAFFRAKS